jgi:hypothetical protein
MAERYSVFTERSTGVNPFYLPPPRFPTALGLLLALPRVVLVAALLPLLLLCDALSGALCSPFLYRWLCAPLARGVLFALGFGCGGLQARTLRPGQDMVWRRVGGAPAAAAPAGTLLLVNASSWLDSLVLLAALGAPLALPCAAGGGGLAAPGLWRALVRAFRRGPPPPCGGPPLPPAATLALLRRWAGPLAVQPEGVPSNGRALLRPAMRLAAGLEGALAALGARAPHVRVLAISYARAAGGGSDSPCFAGGVSPWRHALALLAQPSSTATVLSLPAGEDPLPADLPAGAPPGAWLAAAGGAMEAMLRARADPQLRLVGLGEEEHARFLEMAR